MHIKHFLTEDGEDLTLNFNYENLLSQTYPASSKGRSHVHLEFSVMSIENAHDKIWNFM